MAKEFLDFYHLDELKNFATNILLKLVVSHVLESMHRLISHILGTVHWKERLLLQNKYNWVLG